jgi:hypothetical protein
LKYRILILILILSVTWPANAQNVPRVSRVFRDVVLRIDTSEYSLARDRVSYQGQSYLAFRFSDPEPVCEVDLRAEPGISLGGLELVPSGDFELIDSLLLVDPGLARFKVRFSDLLNSNFLKFTFRTGDTLEQGSGLLDLNLLPCTQTYLKLCLPIMLKISAFQTTGWKGKTSTTGSARTLTRSGFISCPKPSAARRFRSPSR